MHDQTDDARTGPEPHDDIPVPPQNADADPEPQDDVPGLQHPDAEPQDDIPGPQPGGQASYGAGPGPYGAGPGPYGPPPGSYGYGAMPGYGPGSGPYSGQQPPPYGQPYGGPPMYTHYGSPGGPGITSSDDTAWALMAYIGQFAFGFLPPLIVYVARKDRSPFVRFHAAQALNLMLTYLITLVLGVLLVMVGAIVGIGVAGLLLAIPLLFALGTAHLVFVILGAVHAGRREMYRIPPMICWPLIH